MKHTKRDPRDYETAAMRQAHRMAKEQGRASPYVLVRRHALPENVLFVDVETTGLDAGKHSLIEIGARTVGGHTFKSLFRPRPGSGVEAEALAVNGRTVEELDALPTSWREGVAAFFTWLDTFTPERWLMAGLNCAGLDLPFLRAAWVLTGRQAKWFPFSHRVLDLHGYALAVAMVQEHAVPPGGFSNRAISTLLKMPEELRPHHALNGATWCAEAFARCVEILDTGYSPI